MMGDAGLLVEVDSVPDSPRGISEGARKALKPRSPGVKYLLDTKK